jgi:hypothetical protein
MEIHWTFVLEEKGIAPAPLKWNHTGPNKSFSIQGLHVAPEKSVI